LFDNDENTLETRGNTFETFLVIKLCVRFIQT
jgi:hypothetical protein